MKHRKINNSTRRITLVLAALAFGTVVFPAHPAAGYCGEPRAEQSAAGVYLPNRGQEAPGILFSGHFGSFRACVRIDDIVLRRVSGEPAADSPHSPAASGAVENVYLRFSEGTFTDVVGEDPTGAVFHLLKGRDPSGWVRDIPAYRRVRIRNVAEGLDLVLDGGSRGMPWYFEGASPESLMRPLTLEVASKGVAAFRPGRVEVEGLGSRMVIPSPGFVAAGAFAGRVAWDRFGALEGMLEEEVRRTEEGQQLLSGTYLGGTGLDHPSTAVLASDGCVVLVGTTGSQNLPTPRGFQQVYGGGLRDIFLAKLSADCSSLLWCTFLGGEGEDNGHSVAEDREGNLVVGGDTQSDDIPVPGGFDTVRSGIDGYVAKLSPQGDDLLWGTFFGGFGSDFYVSSEYTPYGMSLVTDGRDDVLVAGSAGLGMPVPGGYDTTFNGQGDLYVGKLSAGGGDLLWGTYLGGSGDDKAAGLGLTPGGDVVVLGLTRSADMPVPGGFDGSFNGDDSQGDFYVARLSGDGSSLRWGTYLGGSDWDYPADLLVDEASDVIVAGHTKSSDIPSAGGFQDGPGGDYDLYIAKLSADGGSLIWATFYGGTKMDQFPVMAFEREGDLLVAARSQSLGLATTDGYDFFNHGSGDMLLFKLSSGGDVRRWATYFGGSGYDGATFVLAGPEDRVLLGGITDSPDLAVEGGYDLMPSGQADAFLASFDDPSYFPCTLSCSATASPSAGRSPLDVRFSGGANAQYCGGDPSFSWDFGDGGRSTQSGPSHTFEAPGQYTWTLTVTVEEEACTRTGVVTVTPAKPGDGDGDGTVTIGELQQVINMFLGIAQPGNYADCDGDGIISIGEVQKVINVFLGLPVDC